MHTDFIDNLGMLLNAMTFLRLSQRRKEEVLFLYIDIYIVLILLDFCCVSHVLLVSIFQ